MINKQNLWIVTIFSLIIILCIYYFSLPDNTISAFEDNTDNVSDVVEITSSDVIVAMKVEEEEKIMTQMTEAQEVLLNVSSTADEKNKAFDLLQKLNVKKGKIDAIEKALKEQYDIDTCIKIENDTIKVIIQGDDKGMPYANKIIQSVQKFYDNQVYITVEFQK